MIEMDGRAAMVMILTCLLVIMAWISLNYIFDDIDILLVYDLQNPENADICSAFSVHCHQRGLEDGTLH